MLRAVPPSIVPDVRGRLLVEAPEPEVRDRARGGRDRRASLLGVHAGVGRAAVEASLQRVRVRGAEDHLADRPRLVEDVPHRSAQPRVVERPRAEQADLLLRREQELDARVRLAFDEHPPHRLEHDRHGGLVVGAEDRPGPVPDDAVVDLGFDRALRRHGVEVRTEEQRETAAVRAVRLQAAEQVSDRGADGGAGPVLLHLERKVVQVADHSVRDGALVPGRARQGGELREQVERRLIHFTNLCEIGTISMEFCRRRVRERRRTARASRPTRGGYRPGSGRRLRRRREHALSRRQPGRLPSARLHARRAARTADDRRGHVPGGLRGVRRADGQAGQDRNDGSAAQGRQRRSPPATGLTRPSWPG